MARALVMARKLKYFFGDESFTSKAAVKKHGGTLLAKYRGEDEIPEGTADYRFVEALLMNHVDVMEKVGEGVESIYVAKSPNHSTPCFWIRRKNDDPTDFGQGACLDSVFQLNRQSLRDLIRPQIEAFKTRRLGTADSFVSEFSGKAFPSSEAVVDHDPPFDSLIEVFFAERSENPRNEMLTVSTTASSLPVFADQSLSDDFLEFHSRANLRLVQKRENLSEIKRLHNAAKRKPS